VTLVKSRLVKVNYKRSRKKGYSGALAQKEKNKTSAGDTMLFQTYRSRPGVWKRLSKDHCKSHWVIGDKKEKNERQV